ncbi:ACT domain-containing protein [Maricaulis sp.]|uniref:ACT domain-containing protein n=1 Tax=Maricaulis sp. TaxID=1486257 RepID=UPI0025BCA86A|nr:ACT domain-containing protein [Maricaulis sp.]
MRTSLRIELADAEGALMRLIGLVERRGFTIATLDKAAASNGQSTVTMMLDARDAARNMDVLARQVARLLDVRGVFTSDTHARIAPEIAAEAAAGPDRWRQACPPRR